MAQARGKGSGTAKDTLAFVARNHISELEQAGHDAVTAKALLVVFEATHALHIADHDQLIVEIAALD